MGNKQLAIDELPAIDDGWWESILAEEEGNRINKKSSRPINAQERSIKSLDWVRASDIFTQDQIILMSVTGFNKGGLLVEHDDIHGFIPCSHLVKLAPQMSKEERESCLSAYVGKSLSLKIIECARDEGRLVFSERAAQTEPGR